MAIERRYRITAFIFLLMVGAQLGTDIYLPSFPAMAIDLHTSHMYIQWSLGFFFFAYGVTQLFYGPLADRFGRKYPLLVALSIYALGSVLAMLAPSIEVLLLARLLQGLGAGGCSVLPRAIMRDVFSGKELQKINIYQGAIWSMMFLIAPLIGGYIQHYLGWRENFACILVVILAGLIASVYFKETHHPQEVHSLKLGHVLKEYAEILSHPKFWPALLGAAIGSGAFVIFIVFIAIFLPKTLHFSPIQFGWCLGILSIGYMIGLVLSHRLMNRMPSTTLMRLGIILVALPTVSMVLFGLFAPQSVFFLINLFVMQIGIAIIFPLTTAAGLHLFPHKAGKAAAILGCTIFMSNLLASLIVSFIPNDTWLYMSLVYLVVTALLVFSYLKLKAQSE